MISAISFALIASAGGEDYASPSFASCTLPGGARTVLYVKELPYKIQKDIEDKFPNIAHRDEKYQRHDIIKENNLPGRRFVGGLLYKDSWTIVYEHGHPDHIHAIRYYHTRPSANKNERDFILIQGANLVGPICPIIYASFSGVFSSDSGHY